ncbi:MAG: dTMP kinase [Desulfotalea sp.]
MNEFPGKLIIFEGTDGAGKSTQIKLLASYLSEKYTVINTFEPTNGPFGKEIRSLYNNRGAKTKQEELDLFLADRKQHVKELILPNLKDGNIILCDRYYLSTVAYQGAIGFDPATILAMNSFAPEPDLAILLHLPVSQGRERITKLRDEATNDFEKAEMLEKVSHIFSGLNLPYIRRIDASRDIEQVQLDIRAEVKVLLENK